LAASKTAEQVAQDQKDHPGNYCKDSIGVPYDFSRDLTNAEAYALPLPAYKYFLQRRRQYITDQQQQADLDKQAARTLRKLGSS
jgi:hypothetical protein